MGILANGIAQFVFLALAILSVWRLLVILGGEKSKGGMGVTMLALLAVFVGGFYFSSTHRLVPVNTKAIVVNWASSKIVGEVRLPGVTTVPFLTGSMKFFPGQTNGETCMDFTPSTKGGYEVETKFCFYLNYSGVDWVALFNRYNGDFGVINSAWQNQLADKVRSVTLQFVPRQLTEEQDAVIDKMGAVAGQFFAKEGVPLNRTAFSNWDFTSADTKKAYEATINAQLLEVQAISARRAAEKERDRDLYVVETQNLVLNKRTDALLENAKRLGLTTDRAVIDYLTLQLLQGLPPEKVGNIILQVGGGEQVRPAVPAK